MSDFQPGIDVLVYTKKYLSILLLFCVIYLTFMKRFYIQEVVCHSMMSAKTRVICNKSITTFNFIITLLLCCVLYVIVANTIAHIVFNTPLRSVFKNIARLNVGYYAIMALVTYFAYHTCLAFMYWNEYDAYLIQHYGWKKSTTASSVLVCFTVFVFVFAYFVLI